MGIEKIVPPLRFDTRTATFTTCTTWVEFTATHGSAGMNRPASASVRPANCVGAWTSGRETMAGRIFGLRAAEAVDVSGLTVAGLSCPILGILRTGALSVRG